MQAWTSPTGEAASFPRLLRALQERARDAGRQLAGTFLGERERWFLWLPVLFGFGIGIYFSLPREPPPVAAVTAFGLALIFAFAARRALRRDRLAPFLAASLLAAPLAGFAVAKLRTELVRAPVLPRAASYMLEGRVALVEPRGKRLRLLLEDLRIDGLAPERTPARIRITAPRRDPRPQVGDILRLRARLQPPPGPSWPGGFDFARKAWFERLGAIGYVLGPITLRARPGASGIAARVSDLRGRIAARVSETVDGPAGAVAAALLTGLRGGIPARVWADMQASGLAHLLAISGLHMGLVAGTVFIAVRFLLALWPALALRVTVIRIAAVAALLASLFYLLLAGAPIPTQRAFLMVAVALLALLVDRNPLSMRLVALAALAVLLPEPESLVSVSFQMSFAAVVALVATFEQRERPLIEPAERTPLAAVRRYLALVLLTTAVAGLSTLPFAAWHFQRIATYGLLANLVAVPLTAFWIMPSGLLALLLTPFDLDRPFLLLMGAGVRLLLALAEAVVQLPATSVALARPGTAVLLCYVLGGLWLALWQRRWRWFGLAPMIAALAAGLLARPPDMLVSPWLDQVAVRLASGAVRIEERRRDRYLRESWARALLAARLEPFPAAGAVGALACDPEGCLLARPGGGIALSRSPASLIDDCRRAALVLTPLPRFRCPAGARVLDGRDSLRAQGWALRLRGGAVEIESVREARGLRPWTGSVR